MQFTFAMYLKNILILLAGWMAGIYDITFIYLLHIGYIKLYINTFNTYTCVLSF